MAQPGPFLIQDVYEADDERLFAYQVKPGFKDRIKNNIKKVAVSKTKVLALSARAQTSKDRAHQDIISRFKLRI